VSALLTVALLFALAAPLMAADAASSYRVAPAAAPRDDLLAATDGPWAKAQSIRWGPAAYETTFRAVWDGDGLYLRFDATDPDPWHTMTGRDDHLWEEEVVEIFIDPNHSGRDYYELEISPANVVCDLRMVSPPPKYEGDFLWNLEGLETRVHHRKDAAGKTTGWTAAAFLPWSGFKLLPSTRSVALPPKPGDAWRFNVFRIKRPGGPKAPDKGAVQVAWSKPPGETFHAPEVFRPFVFEGSRR
jgi:Carbohydrate family 9 binding domain-like